MRVVKLIALCYKTVTFLVNNILVNSKTKFAKTYNYIFLKCIHHPTSSLF